MVVLKSASISSLTLIVINSTNNTVLELPLTGCTGGLEFVSASVSFPTAGFYKYLLIGETVDGRPFLLDIVIPTSFDNGEYYWISNTLFRGDVIDIRHGEPNFLLFLIDITNNNPSPSLFTFTPSSPPSGVSVSEVTPHQHLVQGGQTVRVRVSVDITLVDPSLPLGTLDEFKVITSNGCAKHEAFIRLRII